MYNSLYQDSVYGTFFKHVQSTIHMMSYQYMYYMYKVKNKNLLCTLNILHNCEIVYSNCNKC